MEPEQEDGGESAEGEHVRAQLDHPARQSQDAAPAPAPTAANSTCSPKVTASDATTPTTAAVIAASAPASRGLPTMRSR